MNRGKTLNIKKRPYPTKNNIYIVVILIIITFLVITVLDNMVEKDGAWKPNYSKVQLDHIVNKADLSVDDYHTLLMQTGLGKPSVDALMEDTQIGTDRESLFREFQDDFFSSGYYKCGKIGWIVNEERIRNDQGQLMKGFEIPSLKDGDILITKATHTVGWRHGHAAIVTDSTKGETLEAALLGYNTNIQRIGKWQTYPSFLLLRLKDDIANEIDEDKVADEIAKFAMEFVYDIPYGLFTGIPNKAPENINKTQCSHLVWYPYFHFGYDLDSDGSWLVTPKDIANSDLLEIVQVYGVNPEEIWP